MSAATEIINEIRGVLEQIRTANGYHTELGARVHRGRPPLLRISQSSLPAIAIATESAEIVVKQSARPAAQIRRDVRVMALVDATARDYEPQLDDAHEDLTRALMALVATPPAGWDLEISGGQYLAPEDGSNLAAVEFSITITHYVKR